MTYKEYNRHFAEDGNRNEDDKSSDTQMDVN